TNPTGSAGSGTGGATYDGHGNTSVGGTVEVHVGPLTNGASTANTSGCNSGDQCTGDLIDTGGAGNPNNGAGENNSGKFGNGIQEN
ncbi:MAG TPA: hypothetical protein VHD37_00155, partial [Candidatus Paceibacterota bacterium]|nr:hypothetical protein [Candidatus Paceibacterota bacterium]